MDITLVHCHPTRDDEFEAVLARRARWGRIEEKYVVINTPSIGFIDKDIRFLADVWIMMLTKGIGHVPLLRAAAVRTWRQWEAADPEEGGSSSSTTSSGTRLRSLYDQLMREKQKHIRGEEGQAFITVEDHGEKLEKAREQASATSGTKTLSHSILTPSTKTPVSGPSVRPSA